MSFNQTNPNFANYQNSQLQAQGINPAPFPQIPYKPITFEKLSNLIGITYNLSAIENINTITQRIIDMMTQDKIEALRTELQSAQLALQNNAQTQTLINELRPCAIPAYLTCSPYTALGYNNSGCGCGC